MLGDKCIHSKVLSFTCVPFLCQPFLISGSFYFLRNKLQVVAAEDLEQTQRITMLKLPLETQQEPS